MEAYFSPLGRSPKRGVQQLTRVRDNDPPFLKVARCSMLHRHALFKTRQSGEGPSSHICPCHRGLENYQMTCFSHQLVLFQEPPHPARCRRAWKGQYTAIQTQLREEADGNGYSISQPQGLHKDILFPSRLGSLRLWGGDGRAGIKGNHLLP